MNISKEKTIGEIAAYDYNTSFVFEKFGIDFYCKGNSSIDEVCQKKNMNSLILIEELNNTLSKTDLKSPDYNSWPIALLVDYIEKNHHKYEKEKIPVLKNYLYKLCREQGEKHPELLAINEIFEESTVGLSAHMEKEELIIFSNIRKMESLRKRKLPPTSSFFLTMNSIEIMKQEHTVISEQFKEISELSHNYNPPYNADNLYKVTFDLLKEFERDLYMHFHLENNILFPKTIEMKNYDKEH